MQGAIVANQAPVSLGRVTPIARLTGEYEVIVVPAASPLRSLADLVEAFPNESGVDLLGRRIGRRHRSTVRGSARAIRGIAPPGSTTSRSREEGRHSALFSAIRCPPVSPDTESSRRTSRAARFAHWRSRRLRA